MPFDIDLFFGTLHALGFATGAALCAMLGVLQWRTANITGASRGVMWLWVCGFLWTSGNFLHLLLQASGVPGSSHILRAIDALAWSSTVIGLPSLTLSATPPNRPLLRYSILALSIASNGTVFALFMAAGFLAHPPLPVEQVANLAFDNLILHLPVFAALLFLRVRNRPRKGGNSRIWVIWASVVLFGVLFTATAIGKSIDHSLLAEITGLIGAQWAIPTTVLTAAALAKTDYADIVLKRSLMLILSVVVATAVAWQIPGLPRGLPLVLASLAGAAMILAAPQFHRGLGWLVERVLLRKPNYAVMARNFADEARRIGDPADLLALAEQRIGAALDLEATLAPTAEAEDSVRLPIKGGKLLQLAPARRAKALMQAEHTFLDAIGDEVARREDALHFEAERREREVRETKLKTAVVEARLEALRAQVDPHFLFNTLNAITDLIATSPAKAEAMTERLAAFFRYTLTRQERTASTLDEELDFVRQYLDIEQVRFGDRLAVEIVKEKGLGAEMVPSLILQPLVENAIRHGLASKREGGRVRVCASREGRKLRLEVTDNGVGIRDKSVPGVGLANVRERLFALHGDAASMTVGKGPGGKGASIVLLAPAA